MRRAAVQRIRAIESRLPDWLDGPRTYRLGAHSPRSLGRGIFDRIMLNQGTTRDLAGMNGQPAQKDAQKVLLHEIVHTRQKAIGNMARRPDAEAGAELIARKLAKSMFGHTVTSYQPYNDELARFKAAHGDNAVRHARANLKAPSAKSPEPEMRLPGVQRKQQNQRLKAKRQARAAVIEARLRK